MVTKILENVSTARNNGIRMEQNLRYALTGHMADRHDSTPFDKGSDIEELHMSVKSAKATLVAASMMSAKTFEGQVEEYFSRVASKAFAYVTKDNVAYIMNATEFRAFVEKFGSFQQESEKNGGGYKVRLKSESKALLNWLAAAALPA